MSGKKKQIKKALESIEKKRAEALKPKRIDGTVSQPSSDFYEDLLSLYKTDIQLCSSLKIIPQVFASLKIILEDIPYDTRGKVSYFNSTSSKILLLLLYFQTASPFFITTLTNGKVKTTEQILRAVKRAITLFRNDILDATIIYRNENFADHFTAIVDCTIVRRSHPLTSFSEAKKFYSGKSCCYCYKKEVVVNSITGSAFYISPGRPGSVHDMVLLRNTSRYIQDIIVDNGILADKGYVGADGIISSIKIPSDSECDAELKSQRSLIERYFGRLKTRFNVLNGVFPLSDENFDDIFDLCCGILNLELGDMPLTENDGNVNQILLDNIKIEAELKKRKKRESNAKSRANKKKRLEKAMGL